MRNSTLTIIIYGIIFLAACTPEPEPSALVLSRVNQTDYIKLNDGTIDEYGSTSTYSYTASKLSSLKHVTTFNGQPNNTIDWDFYYDGDKLERIEIHQDGFTTTKYLDYTSPNKVITTNSPPSDLIGEFNFAGGLLMETSFTSNSGADTSGSVMTYEGDNVKTLQVTINTHQGTIIERYEYSYGNRTHAYTGLPIEVNMLLGPPNRFGPNNMIKRVVRDENDNILHEFDYSHEFNAQGYPTKRTTTNQANEITQVFTFEYL